MSKLLSFSLYYVSFAPLWLSVLFIDIKSCVENNTELWTEKISIGCILIAMLVCIIILVINLRSNGKEGTLSQTLIRVTEEKTITAEYLLSYILPLFAFDFTVWHEVVLFLMFFFTFGFLCIKHNHFSVNIVLELMDFNFYICECKNDDDVKTEISVISHRKLSGYVGDKIFLKSLNNEFKLDIGT